MGKISRNPRYVIETTGTDLLCLEDIGGGIVNSEKLEKMRYF